MSIESQKESNGSLGDIESKRNSKPRGKGTKKPVSATQVNTLKKKVSELEAERDNLKELLLRKAAEFENYKKRRDNEVIQMIANSNAELITQLLPILDDLERSLKSAQESRDFDGFYSGVELISKKLMSVLEKEGVQPIESIGQKFDPELHEALMQVESNDHPPNTIVEEHLKGYKLHDRVLRHAQVLVSK